MTEITKECEACGAKFTPTSKLQKYCPDCGSHGLRIKRQYERNIARSIRYQNLVSPEVFTHTCSVCGKIFKTTYSSRKFCSDKCGKIAAKQKLICTQCGKPLTDVMSIDDIPDSEIHKRTHFCSDACKDAYELIKNPPRTCEYCGKTYRNKNKYFCCNDCQIKYRQAHKGATPSTPLPRKPHKKVARTYRCDICGKTCTHPQFQACKINGIYKTHVICSKECMNKFKRMKLKTEERAEQKKLDDYIKENGCCGICTTSYKDCERMQSEFRIIPKGAKYVNSKIVQCPKFKTKFKP